MVKNVADGKGLRCGKLGLESCHSIGKCTHIFVGRLLSALNPSKLGKHIDLALFYPGDNFKYATQLNLHSWAWVCLDVTRHLQ
ncbi:hypothetical protein ANAPC5_01381 [Anaplasma phagocytophilum]|nr:hypothetical protein ANAPC5_01381 [Anaplasma phagocytophilum]